jgi:SAM-dependent methyltransferase
MQNTPLYDDFSSQYDRFVNWEARLAYEMPFLVELLAPFAGGRVLDVACGTGQHAIALAGRGFRVTGADLSRGMIARARQNAERAGVDLELVTAGFGELAEQLKPGFDVLLCLGNSLPHALDNRELEQALADFAALLRPGGLLVIQNRNFDAVLFSAQRWMPPESAQQADREWLFLRFYDFNADGTLTFNLLTLEREAGGSWSQRADATRLRPWRQTELTQALTQAGFVSQRCYGDMQGNAFDLDQSGNLVVSSVLAS